jgi:hypothetical protein
MPVRDFQPQKAKNGFVYANRVSRKDAKIAKENLIVLGFFAAFASLREIILSIH